MNSFVSALNFSFAGETVGPWNNFNFVQGDPNVVGQELEDVTYCQLPFADSNGHGGHHVAPLILSLSTFV